MKMKNKQYKLRDYILIPYRTAPLLTISCLVTRFIGAGSVGLLAFMTGVFLDDAIHFLGSDTKWKLTSFLGVLALIGIGWLCDSVHTLLEIRLSLKLNRELTEAFTVKKSSVKYSCMESKDAGELMERGGAGTRGAVDGGIS